MLKIELASVIDWGEAFVKGTYSLEGDGPLAFTAYEKVQSIVTSIRIENSPNVNVVVRDITSDSTIQQQLIADAKNCVQPGLDYFQNQFDTSLSALRVAFKYARPFCPHKVGFLKPTAADVDGLSVFPFIKLQHISKLKEKLATYLAKAEGTSVHVNHLEWQKQGAAAVPTWAATARKILAMQPSSAATERVFSLLKSGFSNQQDNSLQDYIESSIMLQFNKIIADV